MKIVAVFAFLSVTIFIDANAQRFTGFKAAQRAAEYEAQRYLMREVFELTEQSDIELNLGECADFVDDDNSFIFRMTAFRWNEELGVVITSMVVKNDWNDSDLWLFKNVSLSESEYNRLNRFTAELTQKVDRLNSHQIRKFNERIIVESNKDDFGEAEIVLWIDDNRHAFPIENWNAIYKRFAIFSKGLDNE